MLWEFSPRAPTLASQNSLDLTMRVCDMPVQFAEIVIAPQRLTMPGLFMAAASSSGLSSIIVMFSQHAPANDSQVPKSCLLLKKVRCCWLSAWLLEQTLCAEKANPLHQADLHRTCTDIELCPERVREA